MVCYFRIKQKFKIVDHFLTPQNARSKESEKDQQLPEKISPLALRIYLYLPFLTDK
ncbi:protein of unknown function [Xenorhabdus doucetiae]|uniref:Uncharacterized protein n=1 Tax=Xenorhabdus doucetiae TaxID=351671 RepID=A0A068QQD2_9GAMM|nr:protein of unknown function [Xenorhabdus doucetiae]